VVRELQPGDPRLIGPYRLLGQLGGGGMGRVYLGLSEGGRPVAVKVIRAELAVDPDFRVRFRREVAAARKVNGLYTALVVDADPEAEAPWLATAYVAGPSLAEAVRNHGALPTATVLTLTAGLAESLAAIHAVGLIHRDLKPSNVLLAEDGPRVIDFGISRAAEATSVTHRGLVIGSPGFLSPEQAQGHDVGPPSDVFSLGTVLAFAVTGQPPFGEGPTAALIYRVVHDPAQLDQVPAQIRPLIERCLAKDPSQRPSARDLLALAGAAQPATGWLPEPISHAFTPYPVPAGPGLAPPPPVPGDPDASDQAQHGQTPPAPPGTGPTITGPKPLPPPDAIAGQPGSASPPGDQRGPRDRRRRARTLTLAGLIAAVLAASAATGLVLTAGHPTAPRDRAAAATTPATFTSTDAPSPSPHTSASTASHPPTTGPPSTPRATVCEPDGTGCTKGGTYSGPNALISGNYGGFKVVWTESVVQPYSSGVPLYWTAYVTYTNIESSTLSLGCTGDVADLSSVREYISGGAGDTGGFVPADSTTCSENPSWTVDVQPGGTAEADVTFHNVPWPGSAVALQWGDVGMSAYVYPFN
jgi:Protein kinase domain